MHAAKIFISSVIVCGLVTAGFTQDKEKEKAKGAKEPEVVEAKLEKVPRAKFVDFGTELGLHLTSIDGLGDCVDRARIASNPIELAMAAKLLATAEAVSGKKASLTAAALSTEATELAKLRSNAREVAVVAGLVDAKAAEDLKEFGKALESSKPEAGQTLKDLDGRLEVDNHGHSELHIYADGNEIGHVGPHSVETFHVHGVEHVVARDNFGHKWVAHFHDHIHFGRMFIQGSHHHHDD